MNLDRLRQLCLSFAGATEHLQWGDNLVFKVGGSMVNAFTGPTLTES